MLGSSDLATQHYIDVGAELSDTGATVEPLDEARRAGHEIGRKGAGPS